ncbi:hypothetical protein SAMN05216370_3673 [Pseudomonas peli]|jgi:hypothetical protein|uniref:Lipoprotein n=1 Tax=Pseudomonas peli TaxID=592361 RepID=A0AB37ZC27_9PSED|nr:hypothetical protein [Pseudomonas peli]MDR7025883.1 hypothetical protein [Pseudomonas peli]NMZ71018.1 hypothetical protein [Pseudomonas peli]SCW81493.1 hypothetical protein SAMN05216370_3673 [Pseudomonas peli]|tara:strand:+ start:11449 stop:11736 length:288 start_codon:yes stop_codon:yes gene_type:complete
MSLQALWLLIEGQPGQWLNGLALFFALAGAWLLLATRLREQRAQARVLAGNELNELAEQAYACDEPTWRLNQFFVRFGSVCLGCALLLSWLSTRL